MRFGRHAGDRGLDTGVDALERAFELEWCRASQSARPGSRARPRPRLLADERLRDRDFAHHIARIAAPHDDLVHARLAQMQAQRELGRGGGGRRVARQQIDLERRGVQRLDGETTAEQRREVRTQARVARFDAQAFDA